MTTILQISDPHLMSDRSGRLKGVPTAQSLADVLTVARQRYPECDRVVWTGDLSHEHTVQGYELLKELAGDWLERSLFIPGNHDDRGALRQVFPKVEGEGDQPLGFCAELGRWQLIGLDSHLPGEVAGAFSDEQLDQLHFWLAENPERPTLLFTHHPPASVQNEGLDAIGLRNPEPLAMLVSRNQGVCGIFSGHVHHVFEGEFVGLPLFTCPSTSFQFRAGVGDIQFDHVPPGFRMIVFADDDTFSTEVVRIPELKFPAQED